MKKTLRPFQVVGARFLADNVHALLGDEPGLGKTLQAISAVEQVGARRVLVICPASVRMNWRQEIKECAEPGGPSWDVISYNEAVTRQRLAMPPAAYDVCILDESHFVKNSGAERTRAIFNNKTGLIRFAKYKWALSGTPVLNRPREIYTTLKVLASERIKPYDNFARFARRYCGAWWDGHALDTRGASNVGELAGRLRGFMLRRTKAEVWPELPRKIITRLPVDVGPEAMRGILIEETKIGDREAYLSPVMEKFSQLGDLAVLLRVIGEAKVEPAAAFIKDLAATAEGKIVVFARHREVIARLAGSLKALSPVVYIGGMNDAQKQSAIDQFKQYPACHVFIGNIQAAGTGINGLQEASNDVVFVELSWVPGEIGQAIDRVDRMGKAYPGPVNAYLLHVPGTLESAVLGAHDSKTAVIDRLMGTHETKGENQNERTVGSVDGTL